MKKSAHLSNILITILFISTITLVFTSCKSPTDISTGLGRSIVEEYDSRLTNPAENFKLFHDSTTVISSESFINKFSYKASGLKYSSHYVVCGTYRGQQSIAYLEFNDSLIALAIKNHHNANNFRRIKLRLKAIALDSIQTTPPVYSLYRTNLKNDSLLQPITSAEDTLFASSSIKSTDSTLTFTFPDSSQFIKNNKSLNFALKNDTALLKHFGRFINRTDNESQPAIIIEYKISPPGSDLADTIRTETFYRTYADYSMREITPSLFSDSTILCSSENSDRYIRIALNLSTLWDTLAPGNTRFATIMSASIKVAFDSILVEAADTNVIKDNVLKDTIGTLYYALSNNLTDFAPVSEQQAYKFSTRSPVITLPLTTDLQSLAETSRNDQVYLYIHLKSMSSGPYGTLYLTKPTKLLFHAIASNPVPSN